MENELLERLSERQCELLDLVANQVTTSKALAARTGLAPGTIDNLLQNAAKTLQVQGRAAAAQRFSELCARSSDTVREVIMLPSLIHEMNGSEEKETDPVPVPVAPAISPTADAPIKRPTLRSPRSPQRIIAIVLLPLAALALILGTYITARGYPGCRTAKLMGAAPIASGQFGYHRSLDRDGDRIACE